MLHAPFVDLIAPKTLSGWMLRMPLLLLLVLGLSLAPELMGADAPPVMLRTHVQDAALMGIPLGLVLLWSLQKLSAAQRQATRLTQIDPVTGLPNRRTFLDRVTRVLPQSGVLLLLDIDHFRGVNDTHGHDSGDLCLMALAQRCREVTRSTDILGRLDGAVFAIYMPGAPVELGRDIAQRLSEGIQLLGHKKAVLATISVGAVIADGWTPLDKLMRDADQALDHAKLQGRARVILRDLPIAA